jgi:hypothetical protein
VFLDVRTQHPGSVAFKLPFLLVGIGLIGTEAAQRMGTALESSLDHLLWYYDKRGFSLFLSFPFF